jgi:hypothetical protein
VALSLVASGAAHWPLLGMHLPGSIDVNDYEGEASIPIDLLEAPGEPAAQVEQVEPPAASPPAAPDTKADENSKDPSLPLARLDAGAPRDAGPPDAAPTDAASDAVAADAQASPAAVPADDAGEPGDGAAGPQNPQALLASSGAVQADVIFVTVVINAIEIRKNPAAGQLVDVLRAIPDWNDFMHGTEGLIDPVRDTDWILISGPSLRDSSNDAVTLHYATSDAKVDKAIEIVSHHYDRGGPYDAGVPGTRAWLAHADFAERVIERPRPHVLVIVPPRRATAVARQLAKAKEMPQNIMPGVATFIRVVDPHHALPGLVPEGLAEMRLKVTTRDDAGADVDIEGDCKDESTCTRAVAELSRTVREQNSGLISFATGGLLDRVDVSAEGTRLHVHLTASASQIAKTMQAVQLVLPSLGPGPAAAPPPPVAAPPHPPASPRPASPPRRSH